MSNEIPDVLVVGIEKSYETVRTLGFLSSRRPLRLESDVCELEFAENKVNSIRYNHMQDENTCILYVPKEIFGVGEHPTRLYLKIGVPA